MECLALGRHLRNDTSHLLRYNYFIVHLTCYLCLCPQVAGVVGLAFNLKDPNKLLKDKGSEGITIALLEKGHPGLRIGDRHDPLMAAFMNGK